MPAAPRASSSIPITSGMRAPMRRPSIPPTGPATMIEADVGSIQRPATVTEVLKS